MFERIFLYFKNGSSSFPLIVGIILFVAFIAMFAVVIFTLISIKRENNAVRRMIELPPSAEAYLTEARALTEVKPSQVQQKTGIIRNNPVIWWLSEQINRFLIKQDWIQTDSIVRSFFRALGYLKNSLGIKDKYSQPWYLMLGISGAGKSSLLRGFTHDDFTEDEDEPLSWWFLKNGVVLDVEGDVFIPNGSPDNWITVLHLLYRYRGKRPINGIILTIPATELYGKNKLSLEDIKYRANYIARKLQFTQNYLGLKLPIYIVITKTDVIPGFQSFCSEMPIRNRGNMLGWSSPFVPDTIYNSNILNMAFDDLENELNNIRLEIFSESIASATQDGIFVFPGELLSIKEQLGYYINAIFSSSNGTDGAYFRGFYFTGDSKIVPLNQISNSADGMAIMGTPDADINEAGSVSATFNDENSVPKKIFFFEDLLLKKIFAEAGIATPIKAKIHKAHKTIFTAKIATAAFVVIGSYGLFNAKDRLNHNKNDIYPTLYKLSSVLQNSANLSLNTLDSRGNEILANYSNQLLTLMQQLNNVSMYSCFVPASWFSSITYKLRNALKTSYQKMIIRTIYVNLLLKIKHMLSVPELKQLPSLTEALNPTTSAVYQQLNKYVSDFIELEKYVQKFDLLRSSGEPEDLNDLIKYTFKSSLQPQFLGSYKDFRFILTNSYFPILDLSPHKQIAYNITCQLFNNFINVIFNSKGNFIIQIDDFIKKISKQVIREYPKREEIIKFANDLSTACKNLGKEGETWLDKFNPEIVYQSLFTNITLLFGKSAVKPLLTAFNTNYNNIKEQLLMLNSQLQSNSSLENENKGDCITSPIFKLCRLINNWVLGSFMIAPPSYELVVDIPDGKMVYWDDDLIKYAITVSQDFDDFMNVNLSEYPKVMQEGIGLISRTNLYAVIAGIVGKAQSFVDEPMGLTTQLTSEEILQRQIVELKSVAPKFQKLLGILRSEQPSFVFTNLRTLLNKIGFNLLKHIENLLDDQHPYMPIDFSFDNWDGKVGAGFCAYATSDMTDLKTYIQLQRSMMIRLALEFAKPVVDFLNSPYVYDKNFGHHSYLSHWMRIVDNAEGFSKKDPHNSMWALEKFILDILNSYTLDNITEKITLDELKADTGDYFAEISRRLKKAIYMKAEVLLRQRNIVRYERLRTYYSRYLERFYPFKDFPKNQRVGQDADINAVRDFFKLYKECGNSPEAILDQIYQLNDGKEAYNFLKKVQSLKDMLGDNIINNYEVVRVKTNVNFNINKRNETNTDYLIDRIFRPNHDANIETINPDKLGTWYFGEPISIDFRWAENDADAPRPDFNESDPDYLVDANLAKFECTGNWSLLRFLQKYRVTGINSNLNDSNQIVLSFNIPLNDNSTSRVYVGLTIYKAQDSESEPLVSIKMPSIPGAMPRLPQSVIAVSNTPILTETALSGNSEFATPKIYRNGENNITQTNTRPQSTANTKPEVKKSSVSQSKATSARKHMNKKNKQSTRSPKTKVSQTENIPSRFEKKPVKEDVITEEPMSRRIENILNSDEIPTLDENDTLVSVSEQPIG